MHVSPITIKHMCKDKTLHDLPASFDLNQENCIICYEAKLKAEKKGGTTDTDKLKIAELLHIDFKFFDKNPLEALLPF